MSAVSLAMAAAEARRVACFSVEGQRDPGLLPRVLELFVKRGLVPERMIAACDPHNRESVTIDIQVAGFEPKMREQVAETLRQIPLVTAVLTADKVVV